ncbi:MAG: HAD-superfamily hydrolase subfamily IA, variant 3 [Parcubacteria group bacterium GW2011_GWA2_43_17]|nr:MAG: HAD-superfamily hydrolase subfamily IA, variant 3 [Parcubacteria group bacterium GW2011_GWA2_43_17]KKT93269.1 MAG: HAD-superfamily hydrolase subfamily IA, variant 3 [Parcubacteria group bacterium GW2011_GWF2_45_11]KKT96930.1 MAG: HAD-superfamily hydrolase subfamily IA, variant 3 [Parcubacteria group bacterium GW2011_GWC2_45_15]
MNKAVIFDMDGLMLETTHTWQKAEKEFLADFGKAYSSEVAKKYQGM